jgi:hypothetical protein
MRELLKKFGTGVAFDPETVEILVRAFDDCWKSVRASGAPFSAEKYVEVSRNILAKQIIEAAKHGERNPQRLCDDALLQLTRTKLGIRPDHPG